MVTINDVATRAGVAKSTVSNVLSGKKFVSEEKREHVLKVCKELNFIPNFCASSLPSKKTNILGLFLEANPNLGKPVFYKELIYSCLLECSEKGYSLLLYSSDDKDKFLNMLYQGSSPIAGAVVVGPCVNDERLKYMEAGRIHCVVIGRPDNSTGLSSVDVDNYKLVKDVSEKLIADYGKNLYMINSNFELTISQDRNKAFHEICVQHGINKAAHLFESNASTMEDGYEVGLTVIKKDSAIITANATIAKGVYKAVQEKGLEVGKDVGVFALGRPKDNDDFSPKLSHAVQDYDLLGKCAIQELIREIEDGQAQKTCLVDNEIFYLQSTTR